MLKQTRASYFSNFKNAQYCALSSDPIPDYVKNGDEVYIIDTAKRCLYDADSGTLIEQPSSGGGGSSDWTNASVTFINNTPENGEYFVDTPFGVIPIEEQETIVLPLKKEDGSIFYLSLKDIVDVESSVAPSVTGNITIEENGFEIQGDGSIAFSSLAPTEISGVPPLELDDALARPLRKLVQHGKVDVSGTDVVCNNGTLKFGALGKNKLNPDKRTDSLQNIYFYRNSGYQLEGGKTYTFSISGESAAGLYVSKYADSSAISVKYNATALTFTPEEDVLCYFNVYYSPNPPSGGTASINCQLELGSEATPYEPFIGGIYADGTPEEIVVSASGAEDQTANAENLFAVGDIEDTQDIISGTVTRRTEAVVSDGTTPTGRYVGTVGEGNIIVKVREDGYTGEIVSFEAEEETPLNGLIVEMEPKQDLHGYDNPWPEGGGSNIIDVFETPRFYCTLSQDGLTLTSPVVTYETNYNFMGVFTRNHFHILAEEKVYVSFDVRLIGGSAQTFNFQLTDQRVAIAAVKYGVTPTTSWQRITAEVKIIQSLTEADVYGLYCQGVNLSECQAQIANFKISRTADYVWSPYENICPISGYTGVEAWDTGKNVCNPADFVQGTISSATGEVISSAYRIVSGFLPTKPSTKYCLITDSDKQVYEVAAYKKDKTFLRVFAMVTAESGVITTIADCEYIRFSIRKPDNAAITPSELSQAGSIESDAVVPYEPYNGNSVSVTFGETVYGGEADVVSGEMPVTWAKVDLGTLTFGASTTSQSGVYRMVSTALENVIKAPSSSSEVAEIMCSSFKTVNANQVYLCNVGIALNSSGDICVYDSRFNTSGSVADFMAAMNGVELAYRLKTPTDITITPTPISALKGENNIWSNAGAVSAYVPTGDLIEQVEKQRLSTAEGDNAITVTAEVEDIVFDVAYRKNNSGGETLPDARGVYF